MQKLITVTVNTKQLAQGPNSAFSINEVDSINEWLQMGWEIEQLQVLKAGSGEEEALFLVVLNDDAIFEDDYELDHSFGFDDDDDDDEDMDVDMDDDEEEEDDENKKLRKI